MTPDGEQWFPFFHLIFYGLVQMAGERYYLLVLVNCLGTGVNAFLVFLFFRRHLSYGLALTLSALYAAAAVHHAIAWNSFYVGYLLSLGFFLGALLLTDDYLRSTGRARLWGIGLCAALSVLSHNYPLVGLLALAALRPAGGGRLRPQILGPDRAPWRWCISSLPWAMSALPGLTPPPATISRFLLGLPGPGYLVHIFFGAFLAPFFYLFWGHYHFPVWAYVAGGALLAISLAVIWHWGGPRTGAWCSGPCWPTPCPFSWFL